MNRKFIPVTLLIGLFWSAQINSAFAIFGVGDVVSDPGSYAYYAEQISVATEQVTELENMVNTAEDTLDSIDDMKKSVEKTYDSVTGIYNRGSRYFDRYKEIESLLEENPRTLEGQYKKWMTLGNKGVNLSGKTIDLLGKPEESLEVNFRDPRDPLYDHLAELDKRYQLRQSALKNSVSQASSLLAGTKQRVATAKDLAGQIDTTQNLKDAQDLTNAFLAEILIALNDLLRLTAHMAESEGLINFAGVDDEVMKSRSQTIGSREYRKEQLAQELEDKIKEATKGYQDKASRPIGEDSI